MGLSHHVWFLDAKQRLLDGNNKSLSPRHDLSFCACKTAWLAPELLVSMCPSPHLWFLHAKQRLMAGITGLYESQTQPVVLCMQNSVICTRMTSLYGFQPSSVFFLQAKQCLYDQTYKSVWVLDLTCRFVHAKLRILDPNNKSLWVKDLTCGFCIRNGDFWTRITCLYGSQTSSVLLSIHKRVLSIRINRLYWFQPSPVVLCMQNSAFRPRITSLCGSKTPPVVFACKTATSGPE